MSVKVSDDNYERNERGYDENEELQSKIGELNDRIATLERELAAATALNEYMHTKFENWAMQLETWTEQMDSARVRRSMSRADVVAGIRSILAGRS